LAGLSGLTRATEWWSYKIPPLLAIGYALVLIGSRSPVESIPRVLAGVISIIAVAAWGYVINDCFDIEVDRRAGKKNSMAHRPIWQRATILGIILIVGWSPALWVNYTIMASVILALDFLLPTIYSVPPIRLKERGVLGILSDAFAAHLLPTLFLASLLIFDLPAVSLFHWGVVAVMAGWYMCVGLRGIITHQILDREADLASGVVTLATTQDSIRLLRWDRRVLYVMEMGLFVTLIFLLGQQNYLLVIVFFVFLVLESLMRIMKWGYFVEKTPHEGKRFYLPFANNLFYSLWMPLILAIELAIRWPILFVLPIVHYFLFSHGRSREHREPIEVLRDTLHSVRRYVARRRFGWEVVVDRSRFPRLQRRDDTYPALLVEPIKRLAHPWDLRLHSERYPLQKGESYQLQLFLRSELPRVVTAGVCQRHSPWKDLGFADVLPLTSKWEHFHFDFTANATEANGGIFLWLGGHEASVEIGEARLVRITDPAPWKLVLTRPAQAWRSPPNDREYLVRVDRLRTDGVPWHIKLSAKPFRVRRGQTYRLQVSLRSEQPRPVTFGISQAYTPFDVAGLCEEVVIPEMFEDFQGDFIAERNEDVCAFFWLGASDSIVEILSVQCRPIEIPQLWHLDRAADHLAWRVSTDDPNRVIVQVPQEYPVASAINLWTLLHLGQSRDWVCRFRLRTLRSDQIIRGGIAKKVGDEWRTTQIVEVDPTDHGQTQEIMFQTDDPDQPHRFFLLIADLNDMILLDEFQTIPCVDGGGAWTIEAEKGTTGQVERRPEGVRRVTSKGLVGPDHQLRVVGSLLDPIARPQRVIIEMKSDADRLATLAFERMTGSAGGASTLVTQSEVPLTSDWQSFVLHLPPGSTDEHERWRMSFRLGTSSIPVEWKTIQYRPIEQADFWQLETEPGLRAYIGASQDDRSANRLVTTDAGVKPADLKLTQSIDIAPNHLPTRWDFQLRADRPREVLIGIGEESAPWRSIVHPQKVLLDEDWQSYTLYLEPAALESGPFESARLFLWLGGDTTPVEWQTTASHRLGEGEWPIHLATNETARLKWGPARDPRSVRVIPVSRGTKPFDAIANAFLGPVEKGRRYRLVVEVCSDIERPVTVTLTRSSSPWDTIGLAIETTLLPTPQQRVFDFLAIEDEARARFTIALGGDATPIEIGRIHLHEIQPEQIPIVRTGREKFFPLAIEGSPGALRMVVLPTNDLWDVKLGSEPYPLESGKTYALAIKLKADAERKVIVGVGQSGPPWSMYFGPKPLFLDSQARHYLLYFNAPVDDPAAEILLCLGGSDAAVDFFDWSLSTSAAPPFWTLEAFDERAIRLLPEQAEVGESFLVVRSSTDAWRIKLLAPPMAIKLGSTHHWEIRLRADQPRSVSLGLAQNHEPWDGLGVFCKLTIGPEPIVWKQSWVADKEEENAVFFLWIGDQTGRVDVADFRWSVEPPPVVDLTPIEIDEVPATNESEEHVGGNGEIDPQSHNVDHAGNEGSAAISRVDAHPHEEEREQGSEQGSASRDGHEGQR
jgi:4-hydroxybenzoate polyprenyltransferase